MSKLSSAALLLSAMAFGGIGIAFVVAPATMAGVVEIELTSDLARNDLRAVYGGLDLGIAVFLLLAAPRPQWHAPGLALAISTFAALLGVRLLDWLVAGGFGGLGVWLGAAEAAGLVMNVWAWRHRRS